MTKEDDVILELETNALKSEADWLILSEVPKKCLKIKKKLQHCIDFLTIHPPPKKSEPAMNGTNSSNINNNNNNNNESENNNNNSNDKDNDNDNDNASSSSKSLVEPPSNVDYDSDEDDNKVIREESTRIFFETPENHQGQMKGSVLLSGWRISEAEITLKFPRWNKGLPHKASIAPLNPWRIDQLQNAHNYIMNALQTIQHLLQEIPHPSSTQAVPQSFAKNMISQINNWIVLARDSFILPHRTLFPNTILSHNHQLGFNPPLPQDLLIEFSMANSELVISSYALLIGNGPVPSTTGDNLNQSAPSSISSTVVTNPTQTTSTTSTSSTSDSVAQTLRKVATPNISLKGLSLPSVSVGSASNPASQKQPQENKFPAHQIFHEDKHNPSPNSYLPDGYAPAQETKILIGGVLCKTYPFTYRGNSMWAAVLDQVEIHCQTSRISQTFSLLNSSLDLILDIVDKFTALSIH